MPAGTDRLDPAQLKQKTDWAAVWSSGPLLRRVFGLFQPFWRGTVATVAIDLLLALISVGEPIYMRYLVDTVWKEEGGVAYLRHLAYFKIADMALSQTLTNVKQYIRVRYVSEPMKYSMRDVIFRHYQKFSVNFFVHTKWEDISSRLWVGGMDRFVVDIIGPALYNVIKFIVLVGVMIRFDSRLTLVALAALPLYLGPTGRFAAAAQAATRECRDTNKEAGIAAHEALSVGGILTCKLFGNEQRSTEQFAAANTRLSEWARSVTWTYRKTSMWQTFVSTTATAALYWYGSVLLESGELTVGQAVGSVTFLYKLFGPLVFLTNLRVTVMESLVSFETYFEALDLVPDQLPDPPNAKPLAITAGRIEIKDLTFTYTPPPAFPTAAAKLAIEAKDAKQKLEKAKAAAAATATTATPKATDDAAAGGGDSGNTTRRRNIDPSKLSGEAAKKYAAAVAAKRAAAVAAAAGPKGGSAAVGASPTAGASTGPPIITDRIILQNFSLTFEPGQCVAIVGPSGCGKSTLARLMLRLVDLQTNPASAVAATPAGGAETEAKSPKKRNSGSILVDGQDLHRDVIRSSIVSTPGGIGLISQDTHLGHKTIAANLLVAAPNATKDDMESACRAAQIHDRIMSMPLAYDTVLGEAGARLSGGERQRVEVARLILRKPAIVIADEIGSGLDESLMHAMVAALIRHAKSSILIAHRLSVVRECAHHIIVLAAGGTVLDRGTHAELMAKPDGWYANTYRQQIGEAKSGAPAPAAATASDEKA